MCLTPSDTIIDLDTKDNVHGCAPVTSYSAATLQVAPLVRSGRPAHWPKP